MDITQLESVQRRAVRFARKNKSVSGFLEHLHWPLLSARRTNFRLVNFYKAVSNQTAISTSHLQKPSPETRIKPHSFHSPLTQIHKNTLFSTYHHRLKPAVTWPAPQTYSWLLPAIPLATSSIITYSHDTLAITGARPLIEDHWRTEDWSFSRQSSKSKTRFICISDYFDEVIISLINVIATIDNIPIGGVKDVKKISFIFCDNILTNGLTV